MALFDWEDKASCGDTPPDSCAPLPYKESVKGLRASDVDSGCEIELITNEHPAIPIVLSDILTEARSGSEVNPIPLNLLQKYTGAGQVPSLLFKNAAGQMHSWEPDASCLNKRVIVENGGFVLKDDVNTNVFDKSCIGTMADADYIAGGIAFTDCEGNTKVKLVMIPKDQICSYCS